jgi:hypothetical protein
MPTCIAANRYCKMNLAIVPSSMVGRVTSLASWIRRALKYAVSRPPKNAGRSKIRAKENHSTKRDGAKTKRR